MSDKNYYHLVRSKLLSPRAIKIKIIIALCDKKKFIAPRDHKNIIAPCYQKNIIAYAITRTLLSRAIIIIIAQCDHNYYRPVRS